MKISGGAMFGNCAIGKVTIVIAPTITVRIAITIATIGRRMKKFAMVSAPPFLCKALGSPRHHFVLSLRRRQRLVLPVSRRSLLPKAGHLSARPLHYCAARGCRLRTQLHVRLLLADSWPSVPPAR